MRISDHVVVLDFGREIADGTPAEVQRGPAGDRGLPGGAGVSLLEVEGLDAGYGPVTVRRATSPSASSEGKVVALLGANGAGKTTTLRAISRHRARQRQRRASTARDADRPRDRSGSCAAGSPTCPRAAALRRR